MNYPSFHVQPIIRNSDQPWFLPKKRLSFAVIFLLGNSSYISGSCVLEKTRPRLLFSSFDNSVFPEIIKVPIGYYCEFSEEFLKRDRTFDLIEAYGSLALKHSSISLNSDNALWLADCFEKMYITQESHYIFKYDLIRNYLSLIIHEGLRNKGNRYLNA